jgi:tetratricopeptide (TPR) repeat protein
MAGYQNIAINKNQIWSCKKEYNDEFGNLIKGDHDFFVLVLSAPKKLNKMLYMRVQPVSSMVSYKAEDDVLIEDNAILGYPFIIETWNEQPVLTIVLEKYIGTISDYFPFTSEPSSLTEEQIEFRNNEVKNSAYLRQSVLSNLAFNESKVSKKTIVTYWPQLLIAASLIGVILLLWQPTKVTNRKAPELYAYVAPDKIELIKTGDQLRGTEYAVPGMSYQNSERAIEGLTYFDSGDFKDAVGPLEGIDSLNYHPEILFYLALAQLKSNQNSEAIQNLEYLTSIKNFKSSQLVYYYLSLGYIQSGEIVKARRILRSIIENKQQYSKTASEILSKLRWF